MFSARAAGLVALALGGCAEVDSFQPQQILPADYRTTFVQVRGCRSSVEHNLEHIVVRTSPAVAPVYDRGPYPFPVGTVIVKEEYGSDNRCQFLTGYTIMKKEAPGTDSAAGDWRWFKLDSMDRVTMQGSATRRCSTCHATCTGMNPPRDFTCAEP
jgi:hypothetical protein